MYLGSTSHQWTSYLECCLMVMGIEDPLPFNTTEQSAVSSMSKFNPCWILVFQSSMPKFNNVMHQSLYQSLSLWQWLWLKGGISVLVRAVSIEHQDWMNWKVRDLNPRPSGSLCVCIIICKLSAMQLLLIHHLILWQCLLVQEASHSHGKHQSHVSRIVLYSLISSSVYQVSLVHCFL